MLTAASPLVLRSATPCRPAALRAVATSAKAAAAVPAPAVEPDSKSVMKKDLAAAIYAELVAESKGQLPYKEAVVEAALTKFMAHVTSNLVHGNRVVLTGFGSFEPRNRAARTGRNPKTGVPLEIKATRGAAFSAGKALRDAMKGSE